jgi:hypothetical protein
MRRDLRITFADLAEEWLRTVNRILDAGRRLVKTGPGPIHQGTHRGVGGEVHLDFPLTLDTSETSDIMCSV